MQAVLNGETETMTTIYYTVDHFVTSTNTDTGTDTITDTDTDTDILTDMETTVYGDDSVAIWFGNLSDHQKDSPDITISQPDDGFHWEVDMDGWTEHPDELNPEDYITSVKSIITEQEFESIKDAYLNGQIKRVSVWNTSLTDGYAQS